MVAEGALEHLVQGGVFLDDNLLRALLSPAHGGNRLLYTLFRSLPVPYSPVLCCFAATAGVVDVSIQQGGDG